MDPWALLGIDPTTDGREIRRAYARLAKSVHPEDDPAGFARLRAAYDAAMAEAAGSPPPAGEPDPPPAAPAGDEAFSALLRAGEEREKAEYLAARRVMDRLIAQCRETWKTGEMAELEAFLQSAEFASVRYTESFLSLLYVYVADVTWMPLPTRAAIYYALGLDRAADVSADSLLNGLRDLLYNDGDLGGVRRYEALRPTVGYAVVRRGMALDRGPLGRLIRSEEVVRWGLLFALMAGVFWLFNWRIILFPGDVMLLLPVVLLALIAFRWLRGRFGGRK